jgi:hypothetical protein
VFRPSLGSIDVVNALSAAVSPGKRNRSVRSIENIDCGGKSSEQAPTGNINNNHNIINIILRRTQHKAHQLLGTVLSRGWRCRRISRKTVAAWFVLSFLFFHLFFPTVHKSSKVFGQTTTKNLRTKELPSCWDHPYMAAYMAHWYFGEKKKKKRDGGGILAMLLCFDGVCAQRNRSMWLVPQRTTLSLSDRQ